MMMIRIYTIIATLICFIPVLAAQEAPGTNEGDYYKISTIDIPEGIVLEVGGLAFDDKGNLGVATRRGDIWMVNNPSSGTPVFKKFAHGLHEPLGLAWYNGSFISAQRGELTRITDRDGDGMADQYAPIYVWPLVGNYHEYSYGPVVLPNGDMLVTLNLGWIGRGASLSKWRGWMLRITQDGKMTPHATGMRSPAGFGTNAKGDIFYTENQGDWVGSGRMTHLELGDFAGHPEGLKWSDDPLSPIDLQMSDIDDTKELTMYDHAEDIPALKPPSVWFPHTLMGISTSDLAIIPKNFGPFEGQLLVGDQGHSKIMRVYQEEVNGVYQGACFPFREGFNSGILRMIWGPESTLYVGMTNRGWASTGKEPFGLQKLSFSGVMPFEIKQVNVYEEGFKLTFTKPVNKVFASNPAAYELTDFTYKYHHLYGSPAINTDSKKVTNATVSEDNLSVLLEVENMRLGYVYEIKANGVMDENGRRLVHPVAYYTLNELPGDHNHMKVDAGTAWEAVDIVSSKRVTTKPDDWDNDEVQEIKIGTLPGMKFDVEEFSVRAGQRIKLVFDNPDDMMHNLLIVNPGTIDDVAKAAIDLGLKGQELGYIPDHKDVLFHTNLLSPHSADAIYFTAPAKADTYPFVCTFPGHALIMRGEMIVTAQDADL